MTAGGVRIVAVACGGAACLAAGGVFGASPLFASDARSCCRNGSFHAKPRRRWRWGADEGATAAAASDAAPAGADGTAGAAAADADGLEA